MQIWRSKPEPELLNTIQGRGPLNTKFWSGLVNTYLVPGPVSTFLEPGSVITNWQSGQVNTNSEPGQGNGARSQHVQPGPKQRAGSRKIQGPFFKREQTTITHDRIKIEIKPNSFVYIYLFPIVTFSILKLKLTCFIT